MITLQQNHPALGEQNVYDIRFPDIDETMDQHEAWCEVKIDRDWRRIRFHDYDEIYRMPGLYETLFYRLLRCCSPSKVVGLLANVLSDELQQFDGLRALDVGAGNGMVGESLHGAGINNIVGLDIIPEARDATERDRPWVYDDYYVSDLTALPEQVEESIRKKKCNVLTTVAALGFGDIPDAAFLKALDLVESPAWLAFNLKENYLEENDQGGFSELIARLQKHGVIQIEATRRYCHRLSFKGDPLYYVAVVASKQADVPGEWLADAPANPE